MVLVLVNVPRGAISVAISKAIVEERLAACVTAQPVTSTYWWEGKIQCDAEETLTIKTTHSMLKELKKRVHELHPYETPEFLVIPVDTVDSSRSYVDWVNKEVKPMVERE